MAEISQATIPDRRTAYHLWMEPSSLSAQTMKLAVTNDGLLTSLNYSVEDKRAEIAGNILKSVAGIGGLFVGLEPLLDARLTTAFDKGRLADTPAPRDRGEACAFRTNAKSMTPLLVAREALETELERAVREREIGLRAITSASSQAALKILRARDDLQARRTAILDARLATVRDAIAANVTGFKAGAGITAKDTVVKADALLDVTALPGDAAVVSQLKSLSNAHSALAAYPDVQRLADSTRIVLTIEESVPSGSAAPPSSPTRWKRSECPDDASTDDCVHIYSRAPRPRILRLYVPTGEAPVKPFVVKETRLLSLVSSADPVIDVPMSTKTLGQQSFAVAFGRAGTLTGLERASSAGLATATSTLAAALTGARQEFVAGLQTAQTTQTTLDAMQAASRASRLKDLQDQKVLVEAQLALQGTTANKDLVAQKQQLDAQIALLASQQALTTAQENGTVSADVAALRAEIQRLQAQLDLLKVQMELDKARKQSETP
ncbi:MAG: hypothetical protein M3Z10_00580 [Gemmatimonadota bacterium]|nr:hypothetical protein [Gemmatimonadota bacterium]